MMDVEAFDAGRKQAPQGPRLALGSLALALVALAAAANPARAVIIVGDPGRNTSAPTGALADSGWQFEGLWQGFTGIPIAPNYFITATHLGGAVGDTFTFNGSSYKTTASFSDARYADLKIWQISGTFSTYAPLYTGNDELNQAMVVYGRGGPREAAIVVDGLQKGWFWGNQDGNLSWGTNTVASVITSGTVNGLPPGDYLTFQFNKALGANTASLSAGDSGGGVFIQKGGVWQLAGINFAVDGPYNPRSINDPNYKPTDTFNGAVYDQRGLYYDGDTTPIAPLTDPNPVPASSYASRISDAVPWIASVTGVPVPEPASLALLAAGLAAGLPAAWRRVRRGAAA